MTEEQKPRRGRPPKKTYIAKSNIRQDKKALVKGSKPKMFGGEYDVFDEEALRVLETKQKVFLIAALGGSQEDCARYAGIAQHTVSRTYREEYHAGKSDIKMRLRCAQLKKAFEGDTAMLKHLGIAHLEEQKNMGATPLTKEELVSGIDLLLNNGS